MSSIDIEILKIVRRIRDRMHAAAIINTMILAAAAALCFGTGMAIAARFIPIYNVYLSIAKIAGGVVFAAFLYSSFRGPGNARAALKADSFGLKERTVTALELAGDQSPLAILEKEDALHHLKALDYKKNMPLRPNRRYLMICLILTAVLALSGFIPNPMAGKAEELHKINIQKAKGQKEAGKLAEQVKNNPRLSEEQKIQLENLLEEIKKELKASTDEKELNKALGRAEKKLEYIRDKYFPGRDLDKIANTFSRNESTKVLADMIREKDGKALKDSMRKLAEDMKKLTADEKRQLADELSKLAEDIRNNPELSEAFAELADRLASGELGDISDELDELYQGISELMENEKVRSAISELAEALERANTGKESSRQGQQGQDDNGHQGQGNKPGSSGRQGQGSQSGGNGQGSGQGSGAGSGTGMGNEDQSPIPQNSSGISKKEGSEKKDGEYERIFTPQTLGGEGETSNLSGKKGTGGTIEQVITDKSQTIRGSSVPYNQVVGQYREKAMESINASDIPPGMKDMVKEYFTSLEE